MDGPNQANAWERGPDRLKAAVHPVQGAAGLRVPLYFALLVRPI
jgi:hypothetical protein